MVACGCRLFAGVLATLTLAALAGCNGGSAPPAATAPTDPGPAVAPEDSYGRLLAETKLPDLKGAVKPLSDYRGPGGIVVVFSDTTCPFANAALGELPKVAGILAKYDIAAVVVNIGNDKSDVLSVYARRDPGTPVVYDETDATKNAWKVESVPTVVFIDGKGRTAYAGTAVWANLGTAVEKAAGLKPGTVIFGVTGTGFG